MRPPRCARSALHRDLAERLVLLPRGLAALVELQQREDGHADGDAVGVLDRLVERERCRAAAGCAGPAGARRPSPAASPCARGRSASASAAGRRARRRARPGRRRRRARRGLRELRAARERNRNDWPCAWRSARCEPAARKRAYSASARSAPRPPRRAPARRAPRPPRPGSISRDLSSSSAAISTRNSVADSRSSSLGGLQVVQVGDDDLRQVHLEQVQLLAQDQREQQVEGTGEDVEVQLELGESHAGRLGGGADGPDAHRLAHVGDDRPRRSRGPSPRRPPGRPRCTPRRPRDLQVLLARRAPARRRPPRRRRS